MRFLITRPACCRALVNRAADEFGGPAVLINTAATDVPGTAQELSRPDWERAQCRCIATMFEE